MSHKPLIGVSANRFAADPQRAVFKGMELHYGELHLLDAIYRADALPVLLPDLKNETALIEYIERLDGVVLAGGADVSPESYGRMDYDARWPGDKIRDQYEIALTHATIRRGIPLLGVCRGMQILNVALGGTLYQDITLEKPHSLVHRDLDIYEQNVHDVELHPEGWLARLYAKGKLRVNSIHHQGVRDLAPSLRAVAFAPDSVIEAVEDREGRWIRAVQWHPEWGKLDQQGIDQLEPVFVDFIKASYKSSSDRFIR